MVFEARLVSFTNTTIRPPKAVIQGVLDVHFSFEVTTRPAADWERGERAVGSALALRRRLSMCKAEPLRMPEHVNLTQCTFTSPEGYRAYQIVSSADTWSQLAAPCRLVGGLQTLCASTHSVLSAEQQVRLPLAVFRNGKEAQLGHSCGRRAGLQAFWEDRCWPKSRVTTRVL